MKLAIVLSHPTQYYSPWFRWVASHTTIDLRVFYLWNFGVTERRDPLFGTAFKWDVDLLGGYANEFVPNVAVKPGTDHFNGLHNPELTDRLSAWSPSAVLFFGYKSRTHLAGLLWCRIHRVPALFRGDSHFLGRGRPALLRRLVLRLLYAQYAAFLPVGAANTDYFRALGVARDRLFFAPHAVDDQHFNPTNPRHQAAADALRRSLGIAPETRVVLFAGKLIPSKQPRELLEAFLQVGGRSTALLFVGDGSEKENVMARARSSGAENIHFLSFTNQSEMPSRYLAADLFVLASRGHYETWGLAVNEAMHMGVPALVSDLVGCQRDLVTDGDTGWVCQAADPATLPLALERAIRVISDPATQQALRSRVLRRISAYTYDSATRGLENALRSLRPEGS